jgi:hypothetical protein
MTKRFKNNPKRGGKLSKKKKLELARNIILGSLAISAVNESVPYLMDKYNAYKPKKEYNPPVEDIVFEDLLPDLPPEEYY